jgi:hypothetical protein
LFTKEEIPAMSDSSCNSSDILSQISVLIGQMESRLESKFEHSLQISRSDMRAESVAMQELIERRIDAKFAHLLDQSSSKSGSQNTGVSGIMGQLSILSTQPPGPGSSELGTWAQLSHIREAEEKWNCPFCNLPLKHEKSYYEHLDLLRNRVLALPVKCDVVLSAGRRRKKIKPPRCLFDVEEPRHTIMLNCWSDVTENMWERCTLFLNDLIKRLKPGGPHALLPHNPRRASILLFVESCRRNEYKPEILP